jgi:hypothetical protein
MQSIHELSKDPPVFLDDGISDHLPGMAPRCVVLPFSRGAIETWMKCLRGYKRVERFRQTSCNRIFDRSGVPTPGLLPRWLFDFEFIVV